MAKTKNSHLALRALCEGAIIVALAQILGYLKLFSLPQGGSVTIAMLPILIYCSRWGFAPGMLVSVVYAVLQLVFDGAYAYSWQAMLGDYILAYSVLGVAGAFHKLRGGFFIGTAVACVLRFACHYVTGATVWGEWMPEEFFGLTMTTPWLYSLLYNGSYILVNMLAVIVLGALAWKPLGKYITGGDIGRC